MDKTGEITKFKAWLIVLVAMLDDIVALVLVFIVLWLLDVKISALAMVIVGLALGTIIFFVHRAVVPALRRRKVNGAEGMIGLTGKVMEPLKPAGTVKIRGEYWKAKSVEGEIEIGDDVEVLGIDGLNLEVRKKEL